MTTQIIQEHPGYYWEWDIEAVQYQMKWEPVQNCYSPPVLHPEVKKYELRVPFDMQDKIGLLIGGQGKNFKRITEQTGCFYIFYLSVPNKIEIWGPTEGVRAAVRKIWNLIHKIRATIIAI